ncbi:MAG: hypothetical protein BV457_03430 [Thermoplasmata archaeon M9B1D]|nr:MAG: hypothetical protein BV457_03430 [Thermoplasmata archaeon M9B1D]
MSNIYSDFHANQLLGCLLQDVQLANSDKYKLDKNDFVEQIHKILYATLHNLAKRGYKVATYADIETFLQPYEAQLNVFNEIGESYIDTIIELAELDNFEGYYDTIRKMSLLRDIQNDGDSLNPFWDIDKSDDDNMANLDKYNIDDILNELEARAIEKKRKYGKTKVKEEYIAGTNFMETKELMKEEPLMGNSFQSEYLNDIYRGIFGFILRAAKSGGGKSILSIADLCKCTVTEYWDYDKKCFVKNKSREGSSLFINTELELRTELDFIIISWISGVDRSHISDGYYEGDEEERIDYANKVLLESGLYIVDDPEFTCESITNTIKTYHHNKGILTACFDYVQNNGFVAKEISSATKVPQREDMVLLALTDRLKQVQKDCGISLMSSVQTNGTEDNMEHPTESCLAGGKSQVRKTNGTFVMLEPTKKELDATEIICAGMQKKGIKIEYKPNNVLHIIKGRNSKYKKYIKVFQYIDLGTGRTIDLFCTDMYNQPIKVQRRIIENVNN